MNIIVKMHRINATLLYEIIEYASNQRTPWKIINLSSYKVCIV